MSGEGPHGRPEAAEEVLEGIHYRSGRPVAIAMAGGRIAEISELAASDRGGDDRPADTRLSGRAGGGAGTGSGANLKGYRESDGAEMAAAATGLPILAPGLVDLQLNGCGGLDFNTLPIPDELTGQVAAALWEHGVTTYYPTVITNSAEGIERAVAAIAAACRRDSLTAACVGGIHLEGPFISPLDGARGAHARQYVAAPDWESFCRWQEAAEGRIRIVTLSPEWPEAPAFISRCAESGVVVSIGHTSATGEQIREAAAAGATMSTHLGNGAHPLLPRHPNYIWEQLADDRLWAGIIADGFHLPASVLQVFLRAKAGKALLVSDAVYLSGLPAGEYMTHIGGKVTLTPEGRLHLSENPQLLAGSAQLLPWGVDHLVRQGLAERADAWELASVRPSAAMGLNSREGLAPGAPADIAAFRVGEDGRIRVEAVYKAGQPVYRRNR